jgi:hypothetical protein
MPYVIFTGYMHLAGLGFTMRKMTKALNHLPFLKAKVDRIRLIVICYNIDKGPG